MNYKSMVSVVALASLSACGGGDSGAAAPPPVASPAPTPAPSPPPVASPTYDPVFDFAADFQTSLLTIELTRSGTIENGKFVAQAEGVNRDDRAIDKTLAWQADSKTMLFRFGNAESEFAPDSLESEVANGKRWYRSVNSPWQADALTVSKLDSYRYVYGVLHDQEYDLNDGTGRRVLNDRYAVGGSFTETSDLPASGSKSYRLSAASTTPSNDGAGGLNAASRPGTSGGAALSFDFAAKDFSIPVYLRQISTVNGKDPVAFTALFKGTYDPATNRISGVIESPDSQYTGAFGGAFFGPQGEEIGITFGLQHPTEARVVGRITGDSGAQ